MNGTIRRVARNVKRWRDASMALRWTAAGMIEAAKGFPATEGPQATAGLCVAALKAHHAKHLQLEEKSKAA